MSSKHWYEVEAGDNIVLPPFEGEPAQRALVDEVFESKFGDLVLAVDGCEEPLAARDRHLARAGFGVDAGARFLYGGVVDVRAENLNGRALAAILENLDEGDGQRVRFFPS